MATAKKRRHVGKHRAQELPVRRWLQLGAASAGVGAALLGWSLVGSEVGVAAADGVEGSSASAGPSASPGGGVDSGSASTAATSSSRGPASGAGTSTSRTASRTAADDDSEPSADAVSRAERRSSSVRAADVSEPSSTPNPTRTPSVVTRFTDSTAVSSRVASRSAAAVPAPAPAANPFAALLGTPAAKPAAQPAQAPGAKVTFQFEYTEGAEYWTPELRRGLEDAANTLAATYFVVDRPVTLTYTVTGEKDPDKLAAAGSNEIPNNPGFNTVVVQEKLQSGLDLNGKQADGEINWSFAEPWSAQPKPTANQYDLTSTAMHELLHSFGWLSFAGKPGQNAANRDWTVYDSYIVDRNGTRAVGPDYRFNEALSPNLVGWNGGMLFGGPNAVNAYGKLVPLFTPDPWQGGSSMSHLDDYTFTRANGNFQMMTSADDKGPGPKTLTAIEQGVLADIGYNIRFQDPAPYAPVYGMTLVGFLFLRRKKRQSTDD